MQSGASGRWGCTVCSYAYDPARGDPEHGAPPGTRFEDLPDSWRCPWCGAKKDKFITEEEMMEGFKKGGGI